MPALSRFFAGSHLAGFHIFNKITNSYSVSSEDRYFLFLSTCVKISKVFVKCGDTYFEIVYLDKISLS